MKKFILFLLIVFLGIQAFAQKDVTVSKQDSVTVSKQDSVTVSKQDSVTVSKQDTMSVKRDTVIVYVTKEKKKEKTYSKLMINAFDKNWDLSLTLGTSAYWGEHSTRSNMLDAFRIPFIDLNVQKWLTPVWSIGLGVNYSTFRSLYKEGQPTYFAKSTDKPYHDSGYMEAIGHKIGLYIKTSCDIANLLTEYKEKRLFHPIAYFGGGVLIPAQEVLYRSCGVTFNTGLLLNFRIGRHLLLGICTEGAFVSDNFEGRLYLYTASHDHPDNNIPLDFDQRFGINLTYRFGFVKTKNVETGKEEKIQWVPATEEYLYNELLAANDSLVSNCAAKEDSLKKQLNELQVALADAQNRPALSGGAGDRTVEKVFVFRRDTVSYWQVVTFPVDTWTVTNRERINIMAAADMIKATPDVKYVIIGYADSQTSTEEHNLFLSKKRSETVYNLLIDVYGIPAAQLSKEFRGGVENLYYNDVECSRSVVIAPAK